MDAKPPFDADELVRWAETYGHPEEWAKKAQALHNRVEDLEAILRSIFDGVLVSQGDGSVKYTHTISAPSA